MKINNAVNYFRPFERLDFILSLVEMTFILSFNLFCHGFVTTRGDRSFTHSLKLGLQNVVKTKNSQIQFRTLCPALNTASIKEEKKVTIL